MRYSITRQYIKSYVAQKDVIDMYRCPTKPYEDTLLFLTVISHYRIRWEVIDHHVKTGQPKVYQSKDIRVLLRDKECQLGLRVGNYSQDFIPLPLLYLEQYLSLVFSLKRKKCLSPSKFAYIFLCMFILNKKPIRAHPISPFLWIGVHAKKLQNQSIWERKVI